jgi:hypothetical protein
MDIRMKAYTLHLKTFLFIMALILASNNSLSAQDKFPDGTMIPDWFHHYETVDINTLGKKYVITDFGVVNDSTLLQTDKIQAVIDKASVEGGVVIVPEGTFLTGALFFKPKTHLYLEKGATLKGSDDISNFPILTTRIEGQTLKYFAALINADHVDGFTISGEGTINGNGERYWRSFWLRRAVNPNCTNMDELRPRLLFISNCNDVQLSGVSFKDSPFWTTHLYKCNHVKLLGLRITSPVLGPVKAPSSDAIDIDACSNVLVKGCYMSVNDDAIALKGGKGPTADKDANNGANFNIIIEDCEYGLCYSALTCGSESIHDRNIILRRCKVEGASHVLWLKMRPDTPQLYEYVTVEHITGQAHSLLFVRPWTQFFDLKGQKEIPLSYSNHVTLRNIQLTCDIFFEVEKSDQYILSDFTFENLNIKAKNGACDKSLIHNFNWKNVKVTQE